MVIDTSRLAAPVARRGGSASRYNLQHAQLAANVVAQTLRDAVEPASMGLISPFASQARLLQAFAPSDDDRVLASTVHRFQGAETDVVLYDAVDSTGSSLKPHRWFTETAMGSEGARLLNVAMSRAREQAILLADMAFLRRHCPARTPVRTFFSHLAEYGDIRQWKDIVSAEGPTSLEADANQLLDDIGHAVTGIDISTAATGGPLTRPIAEILGDTPEQVKISLWYRPDDRCADTLERPLRHHHTMLHPMRPVQESCVVVDSIVWSASGPILGRDPASCCAQTTPHWRTHYVGNCSGGRSPECPAPESTRSNAPAGACGRENRSSAVPAPACTVCAEPAGSAENLRLRDPIEAPPSSWLNVPWPVEDIDLISKRNRSNPALFCVLVVPREVGHWLHLTTDGLLARSHMYWQWGHTLPPVKDGQQSQTVHISKSNLLTPKVMLELMEEASKWQPQI